MTQEQLGFGFDEMAEEQRTAHLPSQIDEGTACYRKMLERHNAAMLVSDESEAIAIRKEAHDLARKLNGGEPGILGGPDAPGYVLMNRTAAPTGTVPMWGQKGEFDIKVGDMPVCIEMDGMLGIGQSMSPWPGFSARAIDYRKPFLSETGYRSFIGVHADTVTGTTPDEFARKVIEAYMATECKGKLRKIERSYVERELARRANKLSSERDPT